VHSDSYSVLWSTPLHLVEALGRLGGRIERFHQRRALAYVDEAGWRAAASLDELVGVVPDLSAVEFLRIETPDSVLTWARGEAVHELGFLATVVDVEYIGALVADTASEPLASEGTYLFGSAGALLARFPPGALG
jgi:hypothetical protein